MRHTPIRRWLGILTLCTLALSSPAAASPPPFGQPIQVNQQPLQLPAPPVLADGRVLVPMRAYIESLGGTVLWEPPAGVSAELNGLSMRVALGSREAEIGGKPYLLDHPAQLINDLTYIPLRSVSEGLGSSVYYDGTAVHVQTQRPPDLIVVDGPLNIRTGPSLYASVLSTVPTGTRLEVIQQGAEWSHVSLPRGRTGWVATRFTASAPEPPSLEPYASLLNGQTAYLQVRERCLGPVPLVENQLYAPVRHLADPLGATVEETETGVTMRYGSQTVTFTKDQATLATFSLGDELFVPVHEAASMLGLTLHWEPEIRTARLYHPGETALPAPVCTPASQVGAYLIMDAQTGLLLSQFRAEQPRLIASTTKIMTLLLALERSSLESQVTVSSRAAGTIGASLGLRTGEQIRMQDLLLGLMLRSGNDASVAVAEHIAGTEAAFARAMTARAAELGATSTNFLNASGLDDWSRPMSTAKDLALITRYAMQDADFRSIVSTGQTRISSSRGSRTIINSNDFLLRYPGAIGVKNGWTDDAGHTLVASAHRDGRELIVVILGAGARDRLYTEAYRLMDHGFKLYDQSWLLNHS